MGMAAAAAAAKHLLEELELRRRAEREAQDEKDQLCERRHVVDSLCNQRRGKWRKNDVVLK